MVQIAADENNMALALQNTSHLHEPGLISMWLYKRPGSFIRGTVVLERAKYLPGNAMSLVISGLNAS